MSATSRDKMSSALATVLFGFALGTLSVAVPLLGVHAGYSPSQIGLLVAVAAIAQILTRLCMGALMRRFSDRAFLVAAGTMIATSCALLAFSEALVIFAASQVVQGASRAFFWTSSQTHAVRTSDSAVRALRDVNLAAGLGALLGPAVAGYFWDVSVQLPLLIGTAAGSAAIIPAALLIKLPPFAAKPSSSGKGVRMWRRPAVNAACWMNAAAGAWKGLLDSYVPVVLSLAGQSAALIGVLLSIANATVLAGSVVGGWVRNQGVRASVVMGVLATGVGLAAVGPLAGLAIPVAAVLAVSGIGAGILQTVGPAIAAEMVSPGERGDALALTGTFRATALFVTPLGMSLLVTFVPAGAALLAGGLLISTPAITTWRPSKGLA